MIRRFSLWLAEVTDAWARRLHDDPTADQLAESLDAWAVDCGTLTQSTLLAFDELHLRRQARSRHPAGSRRT